MNSNSLMNEKPLILDLFSGAGGFSYGFEQAGFEVGCAIEKHIHPSLTYTKNRSNIPLVLTADITGVKKSHIIKKCKEINSSFTNVDVIIGGPPCQGFSMRGSKNINDPRNSLVHHFFRIVKMMSPKIFVFENVSGLVMKNNFKSFVRIIEDINKLGYHFNFDLLNSADYGVPQNRKRLILIGCKSAYPIFFPNKNSGEKNFVEKIRQLFQLDKPQRLEHSVVKNPVTAYEALSDIAYREVKEIKTKYLSYPRLNVYQKRMRKGKDIHNHKTTQHRPRSIQRYQRLAPGDKICNLPKGLRTKSLTAMRILPNTRLRTLTCVNEDYIHYLHNRIITIREMARFQSFPDDYVFYGTRTTGASKRRHSACQVQQVANSVPPLLGEAIAQGVLKSLGIKSNYKLYRFISKLNKRKIQKYNVYPEIVEELSLNQLECVI